ncbi:MAG TPA: hypothetical protein VFI69_02565 [Candidatus Limnocylindrales bacterium]|nr:hypothetical protein [Candidatus Limnocylindrales bacterium]
MAVDPFESLVAGLFRQPGVPPRPGEVDPARWLIDDGAAAGRGAEAGGDAEPHRAAGERPSAVVLSAAFLVALAGPRHALADRAAAVLAATPVEADAPLVALYRDAIASIPVEIRGRSAADPAFAAALRTAGRAADRAVDDGPAAVDDTAAAAATAAVWSVLFPEGVGLLDDLDGAIAALRERRVVQIEGPATAPIEDPTREVLFTSNVLLSVPLGGGPSDTTDLDPELAAAIEAALTEGQRFWYDHPIPIGIAPEHNEMLHGLRGFDAAVAFERQRRRSDDPGAPVACLLSVSVTHPSLRSAARRYVERELERAGGTSELDVYVVTEADARRLVDDVLVPAARRYLEVEPDLDVVGVDGEYGRHYSFLKAIAACWQVLIDPGLRATFKIDLDQVFPQPQLVAETGRSAFEQLTTAAWGARGRDHAGRPVELGMIAGALVNERDIGGGIFTPDVPVPGLPSRPEERVFFSVWPQAASTRAEMMERYDGSRPDGQTTVLERVHVTGGTNGIRIDALRRHRPFTPSFVGRAEDQAYVLSTFGTAGPRLAYVHAAGLIMRHDKEAYAGEAIAAAHVGKLIGDDIRILVFSAYAGAIDATREPGGLTATDVKALLDPFTGCFISRTPITVVLLRFALRLLGSAEAGDLATADELASIGAPRLRDALATTSDGARFAAMLAAERRSWHVVYDTLDALETALAAADPAALAFRQLALDIVADCRVRTSRDGAAGPGPGADVPLPS